MVKIIPRSGGVFEFLQAEVDYPALAGRYTELKPERGDAVLVGLCPLRKQESGNPAFKVYRDGWAHCFSCGFHGDAAKFWQVKHGISTPMEAARALAGELGITLPEADPAARERYERRRRKEEDATDNAEANHKRLQDPDQGKMAREYLEGRGFGPDEWERFRFGVKPDGNISIPYWSAGRIHGVVTRKLDGTDPKYLFPSREDLPEGRKPLYMTDYPRSGEYVLVEGILDQPALTAMEVPAIGFGGSSPSREQVEDLRDLGEKGCTFMILPDNDETGRTKARDTVRELYPYARLMEPLPSGKDAADLFAADRVRGRETLEDLQAGALDALELALEDIPERGRDKIRHLKDKALPLVMRLPASEQQAVLKDVAKAADLPQGTLRDAMTELEVSQGATFHPDPDPAEDLPPEEWEDLLEPGVLERYVEDSARRRGLVGDPDKDVVKTITLSAVGAQLAPLPNGKPTGTSIMLTGESGRGKNEVTDAAVELLPEDWYISFEAASATTFYYAVELDPTFLQYKFIYPNEAEAIDAVVEFLRPMLSKGSAEKFVTNKNDDGQNAFQRLRVEGPITGTIPTTRNVLNSELQTRLLVTELADYEGRVESHTRALSRLRSPSWTGTLDTQLVPRWRAALRSLTEVRRVVTDLAEYEGFGLHTGRISHGARLWGNLLSLMDAHAWLEQRNREIRELPDGERAVVATAEDYEAAYKLFKANSSRSAVNIGETHKKILDAVHELTQESTFGDTAFGVREIQRKAGLGSPGTVSKQRPFLTKSVGFLYEPEEGSTKLALTPGVGPEDWSGGDVLEGFPLPHEVRSWEGGYTPSPDPGNTGNTETVGEKPHTYAENPVSTPPKHPGNSGTVFPEANGAGNKPRLTDEQYEKYTYYRDKGFSVIEAGAIARGEIPEPEEDFEDIPL